MYKNKLHFITRLKDATGIRIFTFLQGDQFVTKTLTFKNIDAGITGFYAALSPDNVGIIDSTASDGFKIAEHKTKVSIVKDKLYISLDHSNKSTTVIRVDLEDYESSVLVYDQKTTICEQRYSSKNNSLPGKNSSASSPFDNNNSFIFKDKLFQFTSCPSGLNLKIRRLTDGIILKQYTVADDSEITFKNSVPIEKSEYYGKEKELTTKQFVRKVSNSVCFVSVSERYETLVVSLGGFRYSGSAAAPSGPGGSFVSVGGSGIESLLYFNCILSKNTLEPLVHK
jgi:hypothetical protein